MCGASTTSLGNPATLDDLVFQKYNKWKVCNRNSCARMVQARTSLLAIQLLQQTILVLITCTPLCGSTVSLNSITLNCSVQLYYLKFTLRKDLCCIIDPCHPKCVAYLWHLRLNEFTINMQKNPLTLSIVNSNNVLIIQVDYFMLNTWDSNQSPIHSAAAASPLPWFHTHKKLQCVI